MTVISMSTSVGKRKRSSIVGGAESEEQPVKIETIGDEQGAMVKNSQALCVENGQKVIQLHAGLFKPPNMNCRIESFGRICQKFDDRRRRWVYEMGFGGLLHFACDMHLPRQLAYWLMTRVDPINKVFIAPGGGGEYRLSKNQVRRILGILNGAKEVPNMNSMTDEIREKVQNVFLKYGKSWETKSKNECANVYTSIGIPVTTEMKDRIEGYFEVNQEEEIQNSILDCRIANGLVPHPVTKIRA